MSTKKGFQHQSPEWRKAVASKGGKAAHVKKTAHEFTSEEARNAGRKGGLTNASKPGRMSEMGKKGAAARWAKEKARKAVSP